MEERKCHLCGNVVTGWCEHCISSFETRPDARSMSTPDKVKEFESWCGPLEIPFDLVHQRIEELMDRPVWTHELSTNGARMLRIELESTKQADLGEVLSKLPTDKKVIIVEVRDASPTP